MGLRPASVREYRTWLTVDCAALPRDWLDIGLPPDGQLLFFTDFDRPRLAQRSGRVDHRLFTLNLVVGTPEDIAAGRWEKLQHEQQC